MKLKKHTPLILFLVFITSISSIFIFKYDIGTQLDSVEISYLLFLTTSVLAYSAYIQLSNINSISKDEFILHISNRWGSNDILNARMILHEYFYTYYYADKKKDNTIKYEHALLDISKRVSDMSTQNSTDFVYILSLLDLMEVIGYFYSCNNLDIQDLQSICGKKNLLFFHDCLKELIKKRKKYDHASFKNFTNLINDIKCNQD